MTIVALGMRPPWPEWLTRQSRAIDVALAPGLDQERALWVLAHEDAADELFLVLDDGIEWFVLRVWRARPGELADARAAGVAATASAYLAATFAYDELQRTEVRAALMRRVHRAPKQESFPGVIAPNAPALGLGLEAVEEVARLHRRWGLAATLGRCVADVMAALPATRDTVAPAALETVLDSRELWVWRGCSPTR